MVVDNIWRAGPSKTRKEYLINPDSLLRVGEVQCIYGVRIVRHTREEDVQREYKAEGAVSQAEVTDVVNGESIDLHMEVVGDAGAEARVIGYVETFFEYCQMTDVHYEGIDVECAGDAVGFWMQECIALRNVEPKGRISAGKVLLPRQSIELVAV